MSEQEKPAEQTPEPPKTEPQRVVIEVEQKPPPKDWKGSPEQWAAVQQERAKRQAKEAEVKAAEQRLADLQAQMAQKEAELAARAQAAAAETARLQRQIAFADAGITDPHIQAFLVQQHSLTTAGTENPPDLGAWMGDEAVRNSRVYAHYFKKPEPVRHTPPNPHGVEQVSIPTTGTWKREHYRQARRNWGTQGAAAVAAAELKYGVTLVRDKAKHGLTKK